MHRQKREEEHNKQQHRAAKSSLPLQIAGP
jgi:hypothetical protein